jgi:prepilin-type N-terminal cleavage/methylation domain-containing protein
MRNGHPTFDARTRNFAFRISHSALGDSAFTLLEMLIVLTILGLTAALVVPALPSLVPDDPVTRATGEIATLMREAKKQSLLRVVPVSLVIDPSSGRYRLDGRAGAIDISDGVTLVSDSQRARFLFTPQGPAFGDVIIVRGAGGVRQISVGRWSGEVRVAR